MNNMKEIQLLSGTLKIPEDWFVLNLKAADRSSYASVVEVFDHYGEKIPHFVVLSAIPAKNFRREHVDRIFAMCTRRWSRFAEIICLKQRAGIYAIKRSDNPMFSLDNDYEPPYGAVIVVA